MKNSNKPRVEKQNQINLRKDEIIKDAPEDKVSIRNSKNYIDCNRDGMNYNEH